MITLRPYQDGAIEAVKNYWEQGGGHPLVDLATGTGKSLVIAKLTQDLMKQYPTMRVVMLVHVRELVAQNFKALLSVWPDAPAGIYSAGLGKRDAHHKITFASIQSIYKRVELLGPRDLILIDEAHLVPAKSAGMYRTFLDAMREIAPHARVCGFSATIYRMDSGRLDDGEDRLFDKTVYTYGIAKGIEDGFLSPLVSKAGIKEIDVSAVKKVGGEFKAGQLEEAADRITEKAADEICVYGEDRKSWLVFCSGVKHAFNVRDALRARGISCETVTGETAKGDRDSILRRFKSGEIRALTNANVLTTGFDAPNVTMIAMLRPTLSTSLYVQIVGRGTRIAPNKENCLILDFSGNIRRHGPVDSISVGPRKPGAGKSEGKVEEDSVRAKKCPDCESLVALNTVQCKVCGHEWPRDESPKHEATAETSVGILSTEAVAPKTLAVVDWQFVLHSKRDKPDSMRVDYIAGLARVPEWVCFDHGGFASKKAAQWWLEHSGQMPFPRNTAEGILRSGELRRPAFVTLKVEGKYTRIVARSFNAPERARVSA